MSLLDSMIDDGVGLRRLIAARDAHIERLDEIIRCLRADRDRLKQFSDLKTRRIAALTQDIAELKKGVNS